MHQPHLPPAPGQEPFETPYEPAPSLAPHVEGGVAFAPAIEEPAAIEESAAIEEPATLGSVVRDVRAMLQNPRAILLRPRQPWKVWWRVVGLYLIGMLFAGVVASVGASVSGATNLLDEMRKSASTLEGRLTLLALAGVLAPLWEETAFRLPLAPFHAARVLPALALFGVLVVPSKSPQVQWLIGAPLLVAALVCVPALVSRSWNARVSTWWSEHFRWILTLSILGFGLAHAGNYQFSAQKPTTLLLIPLLVMPQLIAGVLLAYARLKLGFWFAVLLHSGVNTVLMLAVLSAPTDEKPKLKPAQPPARTAPASRRDTRRPQRAPARPEPGSSPTAR